MRRIGAYVAIAALAAAFVSPSPATAFGLRIGPFHIGIPFGFGHRHHHHLYMHANPYSLARRETREESETPRRGVTSALLYPQLALPEIYAGIFSPPDASSWPFDYRSIFWTAFARTPRRNARLCQPSPDLANDVAGRIGAAIEPTADQQPLLQRLGGALGAASGYLAKSCPAEIPSQPVARLQLMESQIEKLAMALDFMHAPLQAFAESLNDEQRARFAAMIAAPAAEGRDGNAHTIIAGCGKASDAIDWSTNEIDRSVQPTDAQREALSEVKTAFEKAASDLEAHCPAAAPPTALLRLEAIQGRLDSTWRAVLSIQVALANFETKLSDAQKGRFDAMNFASAR